MAARERPHLQYITEVTPLLTSDGFEWLVATIEGGVDSIQLRERGVSARSLFQISKRLLPIAAAHNVGLAINDRVDVATALDGAGVHLGRHSLPVTIARNLVGPRVLGISAHSLDDARSAEADGADYVTFGHVFATSSHPGEVHAGLTVFGEVVAALTVPVLAIGGVGLGNIHDVLATGAAGIAVISAIRDAADPFAATRTLREALDRVSSRGVIS